jgi:PAS domain S-box-containing protein
MNTAIEIKNIEQFIDGQNEVLETITKGRSLPDVLEAITRWIEKHSNGDLIASILFVDKEGKRLLHGAAPSLPEPYNKAIHGIEIGPEVGSCGTAVYHKKQVIVDDIATDPLWKNFKDLALKYDLRACWSSPLISNNGNVLGTFAIYYKQPRKPTADDLRVINLVTRTTALALEYKMAAEDRNRAQEQLKSALEIGMVSTYTWNVKLNEFYSDERLAYFFGVSPEKASAGMPLEVFTRSIYKEDLGRVMELVNEALKTGHYEAEYRVVGADGQMRWVMARGRVKFDDNHEPDLFSGTLVDINEKKIMQERLAESQDTMEDKIKFRTMELEQTKRQYEARINELENKLQQLATK